MIEMEQKQSLTENLVPARKPSVKKVGAVVSLGLVAIVTLSTVAVAGIMGSAHKIDTHTQLMSAYSSLVGW